MFKVGDKVKTYVEDPYFDGLIGYVILIDEGWDGKRSIKVRFATLCTYNRITDEIIKHTNVEIRFDPKELKVINDTSNLG